MLLMSTVRWIVIAVVIVILAVFTFRSRVMLRVAEKPGFQTGSMVEVRKDNESVPVSKQNFFVGAGFGGPNRRKRPKILAIFKGI